MIECFTKNGRYYNRRHFTIVIDKLKQINKFQTNNNCGHQNKSNNFSPTGN